MTKEQTQEFTALIASIHHAMLSINDQLTRIADLEQQRLSADKIIAESFGGR